MLSLTFEISYYWRFRNLNMKGTFGNVNKQENPYKNHLP